MYMQPTETTPLLTVKEVAERFQVDPATVKRWHRDGQLPGGVKVGKRTLRFHPDAIEAYIENQTR